MTGTVCFKQKSNICNAKFEVWGVMGTGVKICRWKYHIWNCWLWLTYSLCNCYGAMMMIESSLLLSIKRFRSKRKKFRFWSKIWPFWEI